MQRRCQPAVVREIKALLLRQRIQLADV